VGCEFQTATNDGGHPNLKLEFQTAAVHNFTLVSCAYISKQCVLACATYRAAVPDLFAQYAQLVIHQLGHLRELHHENKM